MLVPVQVDPTRRRCRRNPAGLAALAIVLAAGCDVGIAPLSARGGVDSDVPGDGALVPTGLPCTVAALLESKCASCHGSPPTNSAPMSLISLADLTRTSYADPTKDFAQRSIVRMQANTMPPGGGMTAVEIQTLQAWVNSGQPAGSCLPPDMGSNAPHDMSPGGGSAGSGLPCQLLDVLQARCASCHGRPLAGGASMPLLTRADLLVPSYADPSANFAQRAVVRMQANTMPPGGGATASDVAAFQNWLSAGEPVGNCAPPDMAHTPVDSGTPGSGLPCDVAQIFDNSCASCHGSPPSNGAPMSLLSYAELTARSTNDPNVDFAARSLLRMQQGTMPPGGGAAAADITLLQNWINGGEVMGSCGDGGVVLDPLNAMVACTSGTSWTRGDNSTMRPGEACINCHAGNEGPKFNLAGTLFPTGHEKNDCNAAAASIAGATIVITDANNVDTVLTPDSVGNFSYESGGRNANPVIALPYTAKVVQNGKTRAMGAAQTSGDCNSCHTQSGLQGAPGRVTIPAP